MIGSRGKAISTNQLWHRLVTAIVFASFFWISLVSQTHIHGQATPDGLLSAGPSKIAGVAETAKAPAPRKSSDDVANCPLCQAVHQNGSFTTPVVSFLPVSLLFFAVHPMSAGFSGWFSFPGHALQTRGPPRL